MKPAVIAHASQAAASGDVGKAPSWRNFVKAIAQKAYFEPQPCTLRRLERKLLSVRARTIADQPLPDTCLAIGPGTCQRGSAKKHSLAR